MKLSAFILLFLCVVSLSAPVHAARFSGHYLIHVCSSDDNGNELTAGGHVACQAYIAGVLDYHNLIRSMGASPSVNFCVPEDVDLNTLQAKVLSYVRKNRKQHGGFNVSPGVALGLYEAYPCAQ